MIEMTSDMQRDIVGILRRMELEKFGYDILEVLEYIPWPRFYYSTEERADIFDEWMRDGRNNALRLASQGKDIK